MALTPAQRVILVFVLAAVIVGSLVGLARRLGPTGTLPPVPLVPPPGESGLVLVQISGAVLHPGLYWVPDGVRVYELIKRAGGTLGDADLTGVDLAERVHDGQRVHIPVKGVPEAYQPQPGVNRESVGVISTRRSPSRASARARGGVNRGVAPALSRPVNVNRASQGELEELPGIGPTLAARIVKYRVSHGLFHSPEDLSRVQGIGPMRVARLAPYVTF